MQQDSQFKLCYTLSIGLQVNKRSEPPFCGPVHKLRLFMEHYNHLRPVKMLFTALVKDWIIWKMVIAGR